MPETPQKPDNSIVKRETILEKLAQEKNLTETDKLQMAHSIADALHEQLQSFSGQQALYLPQDLKVKVPQEVFGQKLTWQEQSRFNNEDKNDNLYPYSDNMSHVDKLWYKMMSRRTIATVPKDGENLGIYLIQVPNYFPRRTFMEEVASLEYLPLAPTTVLRGVLCIQGSYYLIDFSKSYYSSISKSFGENLNNNLPLVIKIAPFSLMVPFLALVGNMPVPGLLDLAMLPHAGILAFGLYSQVHSSYSPDRNRIGVMNFDGIPQNEFTNSSTLWQAADVRKLSMSTALKVEQDSTRRVVSHQLKPALQLA